MARLFTLGAEDNHTVADRTCAACLENYPEPCRCGGLVHATPAENEDADGTRLLLTGCDVCGRSEDQLDEV
jgi:hypothetical protein